MKPSLLTLIALFALPLGCRNKLDEPGQSTSAAQTKPAAVASAAAEKPADAPPKPADIPAPSDVAAPPATAEKSASGLAWTVLKPGDGTVRPAAEDKVTVHYTGWTKDGKMFDSSEVRGRPATFALNRVIKGWTEGVQLMSKGEKRRFWIPGELAYGDVAKRPGAPVGQLTFDVELLDVLASPKTPEDVAAAPATAKKTPSGLAYRVLTEGKPGGKRPTATSMVEVHYSGWTKDGKMFDSSVTRGKTAEFRLDGVIKGWTEGVQLMTEGAKYRFWIPGKLAYGDDAAGGRPAGQLTFDVELVSVK